MPIPAASFCDSSSATARPVIQPDASSLEIAEEPVLAGSGQFQRSANVLWIAVRAAEARVIRLRHVSSITARSVRYYPSALAVISRHGQRHVALTSGQKLAKSTCESWSFGTNPRAQCACAIA